MASDTEGVMKVFRLSQSKEITALIFLKRIKTKQVAEASKLSNAQILTFGTTENFCLHLQQELLEIRARS